MNASGEAVRDSLGSGLLEPHFFHISSLVGSFSFGCRQQGRLEAKGTPGKLLHLARHLSLPALLTHWSVYLVSYSIDRTSTKPL